jgi:hypothetical protein
MFVAQCHRISLVELCVLLLLRSQVQISDRKPAIVTEVCGFSQSLNVSSRIPSLGYS